MIGSELRQQIDELKQKRAALPPGEERSSLNAEIGKLTGDVWKQRREQPKTDPFTVYLTARRRALLSEVAEIERLLGIDKKVVDKR